MNACRETSAGPERKLTNVFERYLTLFVNWAIKPFTLYAIALCSTCRCCPSRRQRRRVPK